MSIKFRVLGGGGILGFGGGGGSADFIFMGARIFLTFSSRAIALTLGPCPEWHRKSAAKHPRGLRNHLLAEMGPLAEQLRLWQ